PTPTLRTSHFPDPPPPSLEPPSPPRLDTEGSQIRTDRPASLRRDGPRPRAPASDRQLGVRSWLARAGSRATSPPVLWPNGAGPSRSCANVSNVADGG